MVIKFEKNPDHPDAGILSILKGPAEKKIQVQPQKTSKSTETCFTSWTVDEDNKLFEAIRLFGKDWKLVTGSLSGRTRGQVCSHVQRLREKFAKNPDLPGADIIEILDK